VVAATASGTISLVSHLRAHRLHQPKPSSALFNQVVSGLLVGPTMNQEAVLTAQLPQLHRPNIANSIVLLCPVLSTALVKYDSEPAET
jgi:hypothetical protein